jgi:hypothetical protein
MGESVNGLAGLGLVFLYRLQEVTQKLWAYSKPFNHSNMGLPYLP